jgi:allantoinase
VVLDDGIRETDVLVEEGRIVAIGAGAARAEIDARGLVVLPGVVDAHVHLNEPGRAEWEGFAAGTAGAAAGGTTTVCDMPLNSIPPTLDRAAFEAKRRALERSALVDVALWGGAVAPDAPLEELRAAGVVGVKVFMSDSGVPEFPRVDDAALEAILSRAASLGLLVAVHAEDEAAVSANASRLRAAGRADLAAWRESRPIESEVAAVRRLLSLARRTGARVHLLHASSAAAVDEVVVARRAGVDASVETCPHYLTFDADDVRTIGTALKCAPPIRRGALEGLWELAADGRVDWIASDHSPCTRALKEPADGAFTSAWGGISGIQSTLPVLISEGVHGRGMSLEVVAQLLATRPAKRLGLHPRKGEIRVGGNADFVLVDLDREWTLDADALETRSGLSPYVGRRFRGAVVRTIVRGRTVYADGKVTGTPGDGWFVQRVNA